MESTGVYWIPIYYVFEDYIRKIWIVYARLHQECSGYTRLDIERQ
jgi:hypothetical protein